MEFRPILLIVGVMLSTLAVAMLFPAIVDGVAGHSDWKTFLMSSGLTMFFGVTMVLSCRPVRGKLSLRQAFMMTTLVWVMVPLFGAMPFVFSDLRMSFTDAYFEAMSGITTTGSTVMIGLDDAPPGILLWRGILQWLGGLGIIVMAIGVLPRLGIGGMQLFRIEAFETQGKVLPRAAEISVGITVVFIALTVIWAAAFWAAGMNGLEAAVHAMTTLATAGYSTSDASIAHFDSPLIEIIATLGMIVGSLPFILYLRCLQGDPKSMWNDTQVHWFVSILVLSTFAIVVKLWFFSDADPLQSLRHAWFTVVSVMTGTGFTSGDYGNWGPFPIGIVFFLTFVGGCAGSTSCGMKVFRFQVLYATALSQFHKLVQPHGVFIPEFNGRPITDDVTTSVLSFFFMFGICYALLAMALNIAGLDMVTALSGTATAMANVGPGLGPIIGPAGTFQPLSDAAKWLLTLGMLVGRLEVFTVLVMLTPTFWRG